MNMQKKNAMSSCSNVVLLLDFCHRPNYNIYMITCQAYRFKLKTNKEIEEKFYQFSGSCRFVWNKALAMVRNRLFSQSIDRTINQKLITHYKKPVFLPNYYDLAKLLVIWKASDEFSFLKSVPSQALQQILKIWIRQ